MERKTTRRNLNCDEVVTFSQTTLLWIESDCESTIIVSSKSQDEEHQFQPGYRYLLVIFSGKIKVIAGSVQYMELDCPHLVKLQAFLDAAQGKAEDYCQPYISALLPEDSIKDSNVRNIEYWYVNQALNPTPQFQRFSSVLRKTEWYQLIRFLLLESENFPSSRVQDMCAKYGLSLAHFRRLSSYALGKTTKVGLRDWRLIRALLDFSGGDKNMTTVAMDYGYSSLSHFSYEVKDTFGLSARDMKQIIKDG